jgi:hypothetical protein
MIKINIIFRNNNSQRYEYLKNYTIKTKHNQYNNTDYKKHWQDIIIATTTTTRRAGDKKGGRNARKDKGQVNKTQLHKPTPNRWGASMNEQQEKKGRQQWIKSWTNRQGRQRRSSQSETIFNILTLQPTITRWAVQTRNSQSNREERRATDKQAKVNHQKEEWKVTKHPVDDR